MCDVQAINNKTLPAIRYVLERIQMVSFHIQHPPPKFDLPSGRSSSRACGPSRAPARDGDCDVGGAAECIGRVEEWEENRHPALDEAWIDVVSKGEVRADVESGDVVEWEWMDRRVPECASEAGWHGGASQHHRRPSLCRAPCRGER